MIHIYIFLKVSKKIEIIIVITEKSSREEKIPSIFPSIVFLNVVFHRKLQQAEESRSPFTFDFQRLFNPAIAASAVKFPSSTFFVDLYNLAFTPAPLNCLVPEIDLSRKKGGKSNRKNIMKRRKRRYDELGQPILTTQLHLTPVTPRIMEKFIHR